MCRHEEDDLVTGIGFVTDDERFLREPFPWRWQRRGIISNEFANRRRNAFGPWAERSAAACEKRYRETANQWTKT
jgi:hypothetical protein